eukprot:12659012-Alexandrium_andersonii.AAC.1
MPWFDADAFPAGFSIHHVQNTYAVIDSSDTLSCLQALDVAGLAEWRSEVGAQSTWRFTAAGAR